MRMEAKVEGMTVIMDPCNKADPDMTRPILEHCGQLPMWFSAYKDNPAKEIITIKDWMEHMYKMGSLQEMTQGRYASTIHDDYSKTYPKDPMDYPLLYMRLDTEQEMVVYEHSVVAFRDSHKEPWFLTRMD